MKNILKVFPIILLAFASCNNSEVVVYKEYGECSTRHCQGKVGTWYVVNNSAAKTIKVVLLRTRLKADGIVSSQNNRKLTLDPGEVKKLGCIESKCRDWGDFTQVDYEVVGEVVKE